MFRPPYGFQWSARVNRKRRVGRRTLAAITQLRVKRLRCRFALAFTVKELEPLYVQH